MPCDLHSHSTFSDGTCTPEELIALAEARGLSALALTDHNTLSGLPRFFAAAAKSAVQPVAGIEFSTEYCGKELHILGLFLPRSCWEAVEARMEDVLRRKEASTRELIENLSRAGFSLDYDALRNATPDGYVNRAHVAAELVRRGEAASVREAFSRLLVPERGYYHPPVRPDSHEMLQTIRSLGGVSVLAHPFLNLTEPELRAFLDAGRPDAMEVRYSTYDAATAALAARIAEEYGLLPSGGSDFHGTVKPDISLGVGRGKLLIPDSFYENLKALARRRQNSQEKT